MRQTKFVLIDTCESCHRECRLLHSRCIRWCCTLVKEICNNRQCKQSLKPRQLQSPQQLLRKSVAHRLAACVQRSQGFVIVASSVLLEAQLVCNGTQNSNEAASRNSNEAASRKEEKPDTEWSSRWQDYEAERTESWRDCAIDYVMSRFVCLQRTERSGPHFFGFLNNVGGCPNPYSWRRERSGPHEAASKKRKQSGFASSFAPSFASSFDEAFSMFS